MHAKASTSDCGTLANVAFRSAKVRVARPSAIATGGTPQSGERWAWDAGQMFLAIHHALRKLRASHTILKPTLLRSKWRQ